MKGNKKYTISEQVSGISMILMLLWLTVSAPFIVPDQKGKSANTTAQADLPADNNEDGDTNPFSNTTEEKPESGANTLSEYLHYIHEIVHYSATLTTSYNWHSSELYFAFHGELLSPPPEA